MARRLDRIAVPVPGFEAFRSTIDEPYVGLKERLAVTRIESGYSEFWTHGRRWSGAPGSVVIQQHGDVHRGISRSGPIVYQVLLFPDRAVETVVGELRVQSCLAPGDARAAAFHRLHDAVSAGADRFALECAITEAVGALAAIGDVGPTHTRPVRRALEMIREQLTQTITLDELARHAGLDKFHLCRAFRAQVGVPPHAYLTRLRILHAKQLLAAGARPTDVAPKVGLYDQSQLNRHFRRIVGMTPGQFARSL